LGGKITKQELHEAFKNEIAIKGEIKKDDLDEVLKENLAIKGEITKYDLDQELLEELESIGDNPVVISAPSVAMIYPWVDVFMPDFDRGRDFLTLSLKYEDSSEQIANDPVAMMVIMEEERFESNQYRSIPDSYRSAFMALGVDTPVMHLLAYVEMFLAEYDLGMENYEFYEGILATSKDLSNSIHAMRVIMDGEELEGLIDYRVEEE